eukprot:TRINITY_DN39550_c0_g1_i2.p1 TRINITY_DN39550_c0_g1~~TRINITY_DN39550_c0_g1_i2.p1  ORF type:complete len:177 (+),score=54.34 TRINITY_DN39550_c0_g1_i2:97-627(+)
MIRRPPRSTLSSSSAASDVYKRQINAEYGDFITAMGALLSKIFPNPGASVGPQVILGNAVQIVGSMALARYLADPGALSDTERLVYLAKMTLAPLCLLQWAVFEFHALSRLPSNIMPWQDKSASDDNPSYAIKMARAAAQTFEQSVVAFGTNAALALTLASPNACLLYTSPSPRDS